MLDNSFSHKYFQRAVRGAVTVYLLLHNGASKLPLKVAAPSKEAVKVEHSIQPGDVSQLSTAEQKKLREKQRKALKKKEKKDLAASKHEESVADREEGDGFTNGDLSSSAAGKDEAEQEELRALLGKNALEEASRLCAELVMLPSSEANSFSLAFDVFMLKKKSSLALRCLFCGLAREPLHPDLTYRLVLFAHNQRPPLETLNDEGSEVSIDFMTLQKNLLEGLLHNHTVSVFVAEYAEKSKALSLLHRLAAARCLLLIGQESSSSLPLTESRRRDAASLITAEDALEGRGVQVESLLTTHKVPSIISKH